MNREQAAAAAGDIYNSILAANLEEPEVRHDVVRQALQDLSQRILALVGDQEIIALTHNFESSPADLRGRILVFTRQRWIEAVIDTNTTQRINIWASSRERFKAVSLQSVDFIASRRSEPWPSKVRATITLDSDKAFDIPLGENPSEETELAFAELLSSLIPGGPGH